MNEVPSTFATRTFAARDAAARSPTRSPFYPWLLKLPDAAEPGDVDVVV